MNGTTPASAGLRALRDPLLLAGIAASLLLGALLGAGGLSISATALGTGIELPSSALGLLVAAAGIVVTCSIRVESARSRWRVVDILVASVVGVVGGLFLWVVAAAWTPVTAPLSFYAPASAVLSGLWVLPGVLGGLIIRRAGAAVYVELLAAVVEALLGNSWGFATVYYGLIEGFGAEAVLALLLYRRYGRLAAALVGSGAGLALGLLDVTIYYPQFPAAEKLAYVLLAILSGAVIAGLGAWALTRGLARTGALAPLASGRTAERV